MTNLNKKTQGFTLVELSIVLVIIGLIIGGILVGQELINGAKVRSAASQFDKYNAAVNVFRDKYRTLPGDYDRAVADLASSAGSDGDNNGVIAQNELIFDPDTPGLATNLSVEELFFWEHLAKANLLEIAAVGLATKVTVGTTHPKAKLGTGGIMAYTSDVDGINYFRVGVDTTPAADITIAAALTNDSLTPTEALGLDSKLDDGKAISGIVISQDVAAFNAAGVVGCNNLTTGDYALSNVGKECNLRIRMS